MIIERTLSEVIIRLPATINITDLQEMANFLRYSELTQKSKVTQKQIDTLVKEVKKGRWEKSRKRLIG
jgi:RNA:NAD 2'-phosphotransferase (TPT1/KptA family)